MTPSPVEDEEQSTHFKDRTILAQVISQIRARHKMSYDELAKLMISTLRKYFNEEFQHQAARFQGQVSELIRPRFLVALSGGIDSAVVTALATRAVGIEHILPVTMPHNDGDQECLDMAGLLRDFLGFSSTGTGQIPYVINISRMLFEYQNSLADYGEQLSLVYTIPPSRERLMRLGNMASRIRTAILYDLQRSIRGRILGTENRPEYCQGYGTKFGTPMSYDFGVLNELYKTDIYGLAEALGLPEEVRKQAPSSGFWPGQTHAEELGASLNEQDALSFLLFERNLTAQQVFEEYGVSPAFIELTKHRWQAAHHKRVLSDAQPHLRLNCS